MRKPWRVIGILAALGFIARLAFLVVVGAETTTVEAGLEAEVASREPILGALLPLIAACLYTLGLWWRRPGTVWGGIVGLFLLSLMWLFSFGLEWGAVTVVLTCSAALARATGDLPPLRSVTTP